MLTDIKLHHVQLWFSIYTLAPLLFLVFVYFLIVFVFYFIFSIMSMTGKGHTNGEKLTGHPAVVEHKVPRLAKIGIAYT